MPIPKKKEQHPKEKKKKRTLSQKTNNTIPKRKKQIYKELITTPKEKKKPLTTPNEIAMSSWYSRKERDYEFSADHLQRSWILYLAVENLLIQLCADEEELSDIAVRFPRFVYNFFKVSPELPICLEEFKAYIRVCVRKSVLKGHQSKYQHLQTRQKHAAEYTVDTGSTAYTASAGPAETEQIEYILTKICTELTGLQRYVLRKVLIDGDTPTEFVRWAEKYLGTQSVTAVENNFLDNAKVMRLYGQAIRICRRQVVQYLQRAENSQIAEIAEEWAEKANLF